MEEADALATYAGIVGTRLFALGTTGFLRKKHGNVYHLHTSHAQVGAHVDDGRDATRRGVSQAALYQRTFRYIQKLPRLD
jgi:ATP-binding cassette, subfamily A (ABC1), member 3